MGVPASLRPFVRALEPFEPQLAASFATWLPRLSLLVGPLAHAPRDGGDPDGYEGVERRGPYERLLLSEWGVALELPDEFLRRAAMSEHLFTALHRREPRGALQSLLLVDPGPDQLGTPRLAQLAAALVADARAQRVKAAFAWGATTEPARLFSTVDVDSVRHVLQARRGVPLHEGALERWRSAVDRFDGTVDVLFVGGPHLERMVARSSFAGARVLRIDAALTGDALDVVASDVRPARALRLPLPDEHTCIRALRDPFEREKRSSPVPELEIVPEAGLCIPLGGRRILVRTKNGLAALVEPNSPRATLGPARTIGFAPSDALLAAGLVGRRPIALVRGLGRKLAVIYAGERTPVDGVVTESTVDDDLTPVEMQDSVRLLAPIGGDAPVDDGQTPIPIPELDGHPRGFNDGTKAYALLPFLRRVAALMPSHLLAPLAHRGVALSVRSDGAAVVVAVSGKTTTIPAAPVLRAYLGAVRANGRTPGAIALQHADGLWRLIYGEQHELVQAPPGRVVGCAYHPAHGASLVVVEDGRRLVFASAKAIERHAFSSPIAAVAPNLELPQLAVLTADGTVTVLFLKTGVRSVVARAGTT